jgi:hypothetical protein
METGLTASLTAVYVVMHVHEFEDDREEVKMIGVYATAELAAEAVDRLRLQPGFCELPDGFSIDRYEIGKDHWTEGYFTYTYPLKS